MRLSGSFLEYNFIKEFNSTMKEVQYRLKDSFNLKMLNLEPSVLFDYAKYLVEIRGIEGDKIFEEMNGCKAIVYKPKAITNGGYAFSNKEKTLHVDKDFEVIALLDEPIAVPNKYEGSGQVKYLGFEKEKTTGKLFFLYAVNKNNLKVLPFYVMTVSTNRVKGHLGGVSALLLNGVSLEIVVQNRYKMRNTDTKNVFYIDSDVDKVLKACKMTAFKLQKQGFAFVPSHFEVVDNSGIKKNLVYGELEPREGAEEFLVDMTLKEYEKVLKDKVVF